MTARELAAAPDDRALAEQGLVDFKSRPRHADYRQMART
jgi:hypothetical protein